MDWSTSSACVYLGNLLITNICSTSGGLAYIRDKLRGWLFWNGSIALLHSQGPPLMIASIINLSDLKFSGARINSASSALAIVLLALLALAFASEVYVIHVHRGAYHLKAFTDTYGGCMESLNTQTRVGRYWNPLTFVRWTVTSMVLVRLRDHSVMQILILLVISAIFQILILKARPLNELWDRGMALLIEATVSIYLYTLLSLTDFMGENTLRVELGWLLVLLTGATVAAAFGLLLKKCSKKPLRLI